MSHELHISAKHFLLPHILISSLISNFPLNTISPISPIYEQNKMIFSTTKIVIKSWKNVLENVFLFGEKPFSLNLRKINWLEKHFSKHLRQPNMRKLDQTHPKCLNSFLQVLVLWFGGVKDVVIEITFYFLYRSNNSYTAIYFGMTFLSIYIPTNTIVSVLTMLWDRS